MLFLFVIHLFLCILLLSDTITVLLLTIIILPCSVSARGLHSDMSLRKRSSSMESLPTPDSAFENQAPPFWAADRVARGRMCNESFRAAVDRSYNAPHIIQNMETRK